MVGMKRVAVDFPAEPQVRHSPMTCCSVIGGEKAIVIRVIARDKVTINSNALVIFIFGKVC